MHCDFITCRTGLRIRFGVVGMHYLLHVSRNVSTDSVASSIHTNDNNDRQYAMCVAAYSLAM